MFHVKHAGKKLFTDAEITKDDVENVLYVNAAGQSSQRPRAESELLGDDLLANRATGQGPVESFDGLPQG